MKNDFLNPLPSRPRFAAGPMRTWGRCLSAIAALMLQAIAAMGSGQVIEPLPPIVEPPAANSSSIPSVATAFPDIAAPAHEAEANTSSDSLWSPPPPGSVPQVENCEPGEPWHWQVLPFGLIYESYMAGAKEPRLASYWNQDPYWGTIWDTVLGGRVGLWRYGNSDPNWPEGWQLDMEGAVFPRLDPLGYSTPLMATDYRFGLPVTYGRGNWQFKVGYYHISSHLGDEYLLGTDPERDAAADGYERINFVRDGINFGVGYFWTPAFRLYGEIGYSPATEGGAEPLEFQFGFEWAQARNTGFRGGPFVATNVNLREEVDFGGNFVVQFGWMWRQYVRGPNFRIGGQYYYGKSDQFEFYQRTESRIGWGVWYDF